MVLPVIERHEFDRPTGIVLAQLDSLTFGALWRHQLQLELAFAGCRVPDDAGQVGEAYETVIRGLCGVFHDDERGHLCSGADLRFHPRHRLACVDPKFQPVLCCSFRSQGPVQRHHRTRADSWRDPVLHGSCIDLSAHHRLEGRLDCLEKLRRGFQALPSRQHAKRLHTSEPFDIGIKISRNIKAEARIFRGIWHCCAHVIPGESIGL